MAALVHEPERVRGGVLLAGAAGHWNDAPTLGERIGTWPGLLPLFAYTVVFPVGSLLVPQALRSVFAPHSVPQDHAALVGAYFAVRPQTFLQDTRDIKRLSPYLQVASTRYRSISRPLLAIHGTDDDIVPYWNHGQRFESLIDDMEVTLLEGHGHALHHVASEHVASRVGQFIAKLPIGTSEHY